MPRFTIYLDNETASLLMEQSKRAGVPYSHWIAQLIQRQAQAVWPQHVMDTLGAFADMPLADGLRQSDEPDLPRAKS